MAILTKMSKLNHKTLLSVTEKTKTITRFVVEAFLENKQKQNSITLKKPQSLRYKL